MKSDQMVSRRRTWDVFMRQSRRNATPTAAGAAVTDHQQLGFIEAVWRSPVDSNT